MSLNRKRIRKIRNDYCGAQLRFSTENAATILAAPAMGQGFFVYTYKVNIYKQNY